MRISGPDPDYLEAQGDAFEALVDAGIRQAVNVAAKDLKATWTGDDLAPIARVFDRYVRDTLVPWLTDSYHEAAASQRGRITGAILQAATATLPPPATVLAEQYLATASNRLSGISDLVWGHARSELLAGMQAGESIPQLRKRVQAATGVSKPRATTIARTEVIGAQNRGSLDQMVAADLPGMKNWLATRDTKTRPSHAAANGQSVPITGPDREFSVGGVSMDGPHDPSAPPGETINCRCTLTYDLDDEGLGEAADGALWDELSPDEAFEKSLTPELRQLMENNRFVGAMLREAREGQTAYARGDHMINVRDVSRADPAKIRELMQVTDQLIHDAPPIHGPVRINVGRIDEEIGSGKTLGYTSLGTHDIVVNEDIVKRGLPEHFDVAADPNHAGHFMPAAGSSSRVSYVLAHEWGHALEPHGPEDPVTGVTPGMIQLANLRREQRDALSGYGRSTAHEGYAEAFAEWWLTRGQTTNPAAQAYAREFGWRLP
jgi:SPP1 gp7 family putative phage head morphogenesis protein